MPVFFDSHTHVNNDRFDDDREAVIARAVANGIERIVEIGFDLESSRDAVKLAEQHEPVYCAIGIHPHDAKTWNDDSWDVLSELAAHPKVVAIGEIGLDYYYDHSPRETQHAVFRRQIHLAHELDLPIVIHDRDAHDDVMTILAEEDAQNVLLHCFSGDQAMAEWALARQYWLAFGGSLTFKKSDGPEILATLPLDRILIETDCPYLTPVPYRGKRNEPAYVQHVAEKVAEVKALDVAEVARITTENAYRFYRMA